MAQNLKAKQLWISRSFLNGFGRGLVAPAMLFEPLSIRRDPRFNSSVEKAWEGVGHAMSDALSIEGAEHGKETDHTYRKRTRIVAAE